MHLYGSSKTAHNAARGLIQGTPSVTAIEERDAEKLPLILDYLEMKIAEQLGTDSIVVPLQAKVVSATK